MCKLSSIIFLVFVLSQLAFAGRYYDSRTGRFLQIDPKAHKYPEWSSYTYTLDNPLKYIDADGKEVKGFTERIRSNSSVWASLAKARHTFVYVSTPTRNITLEITGQLAGSKKATPTMLEAKKDYSVGDAEASGRVGVEQAKVDRPNGVGEKDYSFENKIIDLYNIMKDRLPDYDWSSANSNGFVKFLIEQAGGEIDLPINAYGSSTEQYKKIYEEYLKEQQQKKEQEEKQKKEQEKKQNENQQNNQN